jgi:DNA modification methylase
VTPSSTHNCLLTDLGPVASIDIEQLHVTESVKTFPRTLVKKAAKLTETIKFLMPILVDAKGEIVAGEIWYRVAKFLELAEVPIIRVLQMSPAQVRAYRIAEQRLQEQAPWDEQALGLIFKDLSDQDLDFSLDLTGFSTTNIDLLIDGIEQNPADPDPSDGVMIPDAGLPVTKPGDTWIMDGHRVHCGNSLDCLSYQAVMDNAQAALVITDPPYNVAIGGHVGGKGQIQHREFAMASGEMKPGEFVNFLGSVFELLVRFSTDGSLHYIFMDWRHATELLAAGNSTYARLINLCTWIKRNGGMGSFYRSRHELVFVFKNGTAPHRNNIELGKHGRNRTNVWEYGGINSFGRVTDEGNLLAMHPTVKPVQMIVDAILDCSARGDILLDPFLGSGSCLIAAERTGRVLRGIEIDPRYVDVAIRRWQRHTGGHAVHAASGDRFDDIAAKHEVIS